jgi:hypothetical protein
MADQPGYEIIEDQQNNFLELRLWGFWTESLYQQYVAELARATQIHVRRGRPWFVLCDLTKFDVQAGGVADLFKEQLAVTGVANPKIALLSHSALARLQLKRWADGPMRGVFEAREEALSWLNS